MSKNNSNSGMFFKQKTSLTKENMDAITGKKSEKRAQTKNSKKILSILLLVVFGTVFVVSAYKITDYFLTQKETDDYNSELQNAITVTEEDDVPILSDEDVPEEEDAQIREEVKKIKYADGAKVNIDFDSLLKKNGDVKAWIYLEGTNLNYPIAQGKDNDQYLHTLLNGKTNAAGTVFMDYANKGDFSDLVTVIYGHNMHNGTMFYALTKYKGQSFYNSHPYLYIYTPKQKYRMYVYSGCVTTADSDVYNVPANNDELDAYLDIFNRNSMIKSNTTIDKGDKLVLLSTCSYEIKEGRFVLLGKLVPFE